jgi:hypothetical protein
MTSMSIVPPTSCRATRRRRRRRVPIDQTAGEPTGAATVPAPIDGLGFSGMVSQPIAATRATGRGCETERGKVFALRI